MGPFSVDLKGRVALVTGAGTGVGRATALALVASGAAVCACDVNPDHADQVVEMIRAGGGQALAWTADISNRFQVTAMIEAVRERWGGLHLLINATTVIKPAPLLTLDEYDWRRMIEIDLTGVFWGTQLAGRVMSAEGGGTIVNVVRLPGGGSVAYTSAYHGVIGFTREAARTLIAESVRINSIAYHPALEPEAVAPVVLFLCSQAATFVAGQVITVDDGQG